MIIVIKKTATGNFSEKEVFNMKKTTKILTALALSISCLAAAVPGYAAYELNSEVTDPTPALQEAAAIGVRVYNNPHMQKLPDKDAIVVMSFGTTFTETRNKTINPTIEAIKKAHPGVKVVTAYTSHIIVDRVKANEGIEIPTPEKALETLKKEGYTRVALATLDVIPGMEYSYDTAIFNIYKKDFKKMTLGLPLMYWMGQEDQRDDIMESMEAFSTQFPKMADDEALLVMAHGTPHPANAYYSVIQDRLNNLEKGNIFVYSVEGWPHLDTVMPLLKEKGIKKVNLMPLMMVAGDHANNDMAGDEEDSHKIILQEEGFEVVPYVHGLGENKAVRKVFVERANEAWDALIAGDSKQKTAGMRH